VVKNSEGQPLGGVSVVIKNTTTGTTTDVNGHFSLQVNSDAQVLIFSYVGYIVKELPANAASEVILSITGSNMDSVVVIGYGAMKKTDVTGSVVSVSAKELLSKPVTNALEGLQGRVPGVSVSLNSGAPGGLASVVIRGMGSINSSTDPLYVVDGVAMTNIQYLNPGDIKSMEVLKDASATAIYGARGSNGVILVTTKRGASTNGTIVSYDFSISAGHLPRELPVLNSDQFLEVLSGGMANNPLWGAAPRTLKRTDPLLFDSNGNPLYNTDWQKEVTRTAISNNHQLSIQHKGDHSSTGVFFNYTNNEGIMLHSNLRRYNIRFTHDLALNKWIDFGVNLLYNYSKEDVVNPGTGANTPTRTMIEMPSIIPVRFPDGSWANNQSSSDYSFLDAAENPVKVLLSQTNQDTRSQVFGNAFFNFKITPDLQFKTQFGIDNQDIRYDYYSPSDLMNISANQKGVASITNEQIRYWQQENYLTFDKQLGIHHLNILAGASWQKRIDQTLGGSTQNFADDFYRQYNLGAGSQPNPPSSNYTSWAINSYFARASYNMSDKYLVTLTERADGSSRFGKTNKYGYFPSIGLGYILSNEDFIKKANWISFLKIRGSYGITGNTEIGAYQSLATVSSGTTLINGTREASSYINGLANPDLKWEKTKQTDIGLELRMFDNRISFEGDYYYKLTSDLLLNKPIPTSTGFDGVLSNIGSMSNQGVELSLTTQNIINRDFNWTTSIVASYNKNKVVSLGSNDEDIFPGPFWGPVSDGFTILRVGEPAGSFWGYERLGTYSEEEVTAGKAKDPNYPYHAGEEKESADKRILGKGTPDWTGSFVNTFSYKGFDLMIDLQFSQGASIAQAFLFSSEDRTGYSNSLTSVMNAWTPQNQNTPIQQWRFAPDAGQSAAFDSHWVANGSFIRGRNIVLGYNLPSRLLKSQKIKSLRFYLSGQNVFLIKSSSYKGYDPENISWNTPGAPAFGQNIEFYQYPKPRTFTFGLNATF
jgi:TonB-linked SusC/RagA family outer membrane protein